MKRIVFVIFMLLNTPQIYAVDMTLTDLDGKESRISDYLGKWVVVNYWATWCPPCREEMPELQAFHDKHADTDGVVLGVNTEVINPQQVQEFLDDFFISYPNFISGPVSETALGRVPGLPTTFLISPEGSVEARQIGGVTREMIENFIKKWEAKQQN